MHEIQRVSVDSEAAMLALAGQLAACLQPGDCLTLEGDLGAGKTVFARGVVQALSASDVAVTSPTFNVVQLYDVSLADGESVSLWHIDLYRLEHADELVELGLEEALNEGITLIEWPQIAEKSLPDDRLRVQIATLSDKNGRDIVFCGERAWQKRLETQLKE